MLMLISNKADLRMKDLLSESKMTFYNDKGKYIKNYTICSVIDRKSGQKLSKDREDLNITKNLVDICKTLHNKC